MQRPRSTQKERLENWNNGMLEYWKTIVLPTIPLFQYSNFFALRFHSLRVGEGLAPLLRSRAAHLPGVEGMATRPILFAHPLYNTDLYP
jgi:hypothetical protein